MNHILEELNSTWRKAAAQATADKDSVEKAFMDQAYTFVANKCGPLMNDPHRLGFEVVQKNDDNTKMAGLFAFRVDRELLYVPAFFINGEVKGTDLLYRHGPKKFVPNNEGWVKFLMEKDRQSGGMGVDKSVTRGLASQLPDFKDLTYPSGGGAGISKRAAINQGILEQFITEDGGLDAMHKLAAWIEADFNFAEAFERNIGTGNIFSAAVMHKVAALEHVRRPVKQVRLALVPAFDKSASELEDPMDEYMRKFGFTLKDDRKDNLTPVYRENTMNLTSIGAPGMYSVLCDDGTMKKVFAGYNSHEYFRESSVNSPLESCCRTPSYFTLVFQDGKYATSGRDFTAKDEGDVLAAVADSKLLKAEASTGGYYKLFNPRTGGLSQTFRVDGKKTRKGVTRYTITEEGYVSKLDGDHGFTVNENIDTYGGDAFGPDVRFIEVAASVEGDYLRSKQPEFKVCSGNRALLDLITEATGGGSAKLLLSKSAGECFQLRGGRFNTTPEISAHAMAEFIAAKLGVSGADTMTLLKEAHVNGSVEFWIEPGVEKIAGMMQLLGNLDFDELPGDSTFGIQMDQPRYKELETSWGGEEAPDHSLGDALDPRMGWGPNGSGSENEHLHHAVIMSATPGKLAEIGKNTQTPSIFEHGLVASLLKTYDSAAMIDKYLPKLEEGLDHYGRILFLFYWKPTDFEATYGSDDMVNLENELLSNFKSSGDLLLNLLKKSQVRQTAGGGTGMKV
jgi:hypothetical protein